MMRRFLLCGLLVAACGDGGGESEAEAEAESEAEAEAESEAEAEAEAESEAESESEGEGDCIPDPGTTPAPDFGWSETEPNDTPCDASPIGVIADTGGGVGWMYPADPTIGGADAADYWVIRTGAGVTGLQMFAGWDGTDNLLDFFVYEVAGGVMGTMVFSADSDGTLEGNPGTPIDVDPDAVYLIEIVNVEGSGSYFV